MYEHTRACLVRTWAYINVDLTVAQENSEKKKNTKGKTAAHPTNNEVVNQSRLARCE